jgi:DNA-binding CsgD family transcriptional regulator
MPVDLEERVASLEEKVIGLEAKLDFVVSLIRGDNKEFTTNKKSEDESTLMREFTPKQHAVIQMIWQGFGTDAMAETLGVSSATIKVHIRGVMRRSGLKTRSQIAMIAERCMQTMGDSEYLRTSGIPKDWCMRPCDDEYKATTKMLRTKVR